MHRIHDAQDSVKEFGFCRLNDLTHDCVRVIEFAEAEFLNRILGIVNSGHRRRNRGGGQRGQLPLQL